VRDAILEAAAASAEDLYRNDPQLTDFEAVGPDDLHGECTEFMTIIEMARREIATGKRLSLDEIRRVSELWRDVESSEEADGAGTPQPTRFF
jgi:hypothetical protein